MNKAVQATDSNPYKPLVLATDVSKKKTQYLQWGGFPFQNVMMAVRCLCRVLCPNHLPDLFLRGSRLELYREDEPLRPINSSPNTRRVRYRNFGRIRTIMSGMQHASLHLRVSSADGKPGSGALGSFHWTG